MNTGLIQWKYLIYIFPVHIIVVLLTVAKLPIPINKLLPWVIMSVSSYIVTALAFAFIKYFQQLLNTFAKELGAIIFIGVIRGFAILDLSLILGLPSVKPYILRPINSALTFPLWILIMHFLIGTRNEFKEEFHKMYVRNITKQISEAKSHNQKANAESLSAKIELSLQPLREQLSQILGSKITAQELADEALIIRSYVDSELRPLSYDLWKSKKFQPPKMNYLKLLSYTLNNISLPFHLVIAPLLIISTVSLTVYYNFQTACIISFSSSMIMFVWFLINRILLREAKLNISSLNIFTLFLGAFSGFISIKIFSKYFETPINETATGLIGLVWFIFSITALTMYLGVKNFYSSIKLILENQIESLTFSESTYEDVGMKRSFAAYIHGEIQSELLSASMQMSQAAESGNLSLGKKALKRADQLLKRDHQTYVVGNSISAKKKLEKLINAWSGIVLIESEITNEIVISEHAFLQATEVIEELITNSVRHGLASKIRIYIDSNTDDIHINYFDDGMEIKNKKNGLGTEIIKGKITDYIYERKNFENHIHLMLANS